MSFETTCNLSIIFLKAYKLIDIGLLVWFFYVTTGLNSILSLVCMSSLL